MTSSEKSGSPPSLLGWFLAAVAIAVLGLALGSVYSPAAQRTFAIAVGDGSSGPYVETVLADSDAQRAGVRPGDLVDVRDLTMSSRYRLYTGAASDQPLQVRVGRSGVWRTVSLGPIRHQFVEQRSWPLTVAAIVTLLIVAIVAFRRPSLATAALVLYGSGVVTAFGIVQQVSGIPDPLFGGVALFVLVTFSVLPLFALLPFIARFPHEPVTAGGRLRLRIADAIFIVVAIVLTISTVFEPVTYVSWIGFYNVLQAFGAIAMLAFAVLAYREETGETRRRIAWVIVGFLISVVAYVGGDYLVTAFDPLNPPPGLPALVGLSEILTCALPITLAYAILRHRVLDIGFALNRSVVYAVVTTVVICVISLVDWASGKLLGEERLALVFEALAAVAVGVSLNWLHDRVEAAVDRTVFRHRHLAERRIEHRIEALGFAGSESAIDDALASDAPEILDLASAAVFRRTVADGMFERIAAHSWPQSGVMSIDADSLLVRTMRAVEKPVFLADLAIWHVDLPSGGHAPVLAIPITSQHELLGFALYGNGRDGASLDPEEVSLLARLVAAASYAYGVVEARRWRQRAAELEHSMRVGVIAESL